MPDDDPLPDDWPLPGDWMEQDCLGSYLDAIEAIGAAVKAGAQLPAMFVPARAPATGSFG
jgi:hypothetical protein